MPDERGHNTLEHPETRTFPPGEPWAETLAKEAVQPFLALTSPNAIEAMRAIVVSTDEQANFVTQLLKEVKDNWDLVEAERKKITKPLDEAKKAAQKHFKPALEALDEAEKILKDKIAGYVQLKQQANVSALQAASVADTPREAMAAMTAFAPVAPPQGVSVRAQWQFEVTDPDFVPREYCSPDPAKIKAALAAGIQIPGVRVFETSSVSVRR